jgi:hypothetical protein
MSQGTTGALVNGVANGNFQQVATQQATRAATNYASTALTGMTGVNTSSLGSYVGAIGSISSLYGSIGGGGGESITPYTQKNTYVAATDTGSVYYGGANNQDLTAALYGNNSTSNANTSSPNTNTSSAIVEPAQEPVVEPNGGP